MNLMKPVFVMLITFLLLTNYAIGQLDSKPCSNWLISPVLYNNYIHDSTQVYYWENYWYYSSGDSNKLIPDSLQIVLKLFPSFAILPKENLVDSLNTKYQLKSILVFKYGIYDDSYNVISPKTSESIVLFDAEIDLLKIYNSFIDTDEMGYEFNTKPILIKQKLDSIGVWLNDVPWDPVKGRPYALNQIIITSFFIFWFVKSG